jgi:hypothetical protein
MLRKAGLEPAVAGDPLATRVFAAPGAWLVVVVNETAADGRRVVSVGPSRCEIPVAAGRARLLLLERPTGRMLAATPGAVITAK